MGLWSDVHSYECNDRAIHNSLHRHDLEMPPILNFEKFLLGEENAVDYRVRTIGSASLRNFEPKFVDSQAFDF